MKYPSLPWLTLLLVLGLSPYAGADQLGAQQTLNQRLDALFQVHLFKEVALAPNGQWLAWVEEVPSKNPAAAPNSAVYVADLQAQAWTPKRLSAGGGTTTHAEH